MREVNDRLPRKVGVIAVNHFKQNFRDGGWLDDGLHPWKEHSDRSRVVLMPSMVHLLPEETI